MDALDLIERDLFLQPIVELRGAGRLVSGDARGRKRLGELLDVGRDDHRLDLVEGEASALAPLGEPAHGREVREARVRVPDVGGEELPEAPLGAFGGGEERRCRRSARGRGRARGALSWDQVGGHGVEPTLVSPAAKFVRCRESTPAESSASRRRSVV